VAVVVVHLEVVLLLVVVVLAELLVLLVQQILAEAVVVGEMETAETADPEFLFLDSQEQTQLLLALA
jgi:hypothetical protein